MTAIKTKQPVDGDQPPRDSGVEGEIREFVRRDGQALYLGPTFYARLSAQWWVSGAWNVQAAGHAANTAGALDLVNFERHQVKFRLGYHF